MAVKADTRHVLCFREKNEKEGYSLTGQVVEQLIYEIGKHSYFKLSDRDGNLVAYINENGDVYVPENSGITIDGVQEEVEAALELTLDDEWRGIKK